MPQTTTTNRAVVLTSRPIGAPTAANFTLRESTISPLLAGEVLLRTLYLSLDPYMRGRMSEGESYAAPVALGSVMVGGTVSVVHASENASFSVGELVLGASGWQDYAVSDGRGLKTLAIGTQQPSQALGVLGMPGFTAYMGLLDIGRPRAGDTVVVAAASGAVGSVVGQLAKLHGCRAVGIAGGAEKCGYVVDELGFDACVNHHQGPHRIHLEGQPTGDLPTRLATACPNGIDVYFESVGGAVFDAVMPLLNPRARVPVCGLIAHYNDTALPPGPDRLGALMGLLLRRRITMRGFIIFDDYAERYGEFVAAMTPLVNDGKIKFREDVVAGLENAPEAFIGLLHGANFGKLVVQVAHR